MYRKQLLIFTLSALSIIAATAQPRYSANIQRESLGRGAVCLRSADSIAISWRMLPTDTESTAFNIYGDGKRLNTQPITNATFFKTKEESPNATYDIEAINLAAPLTSSRRERVKQAASDYISIPLRTPSASNQQNRGSQKENPRFRVTYSANDASVGDVDGDGEYEIILKWDPSNSHDNSHEGHTDNVLLDCYKLTGEFLWRIDLGRNIRAGAHYTQFIVYDLDGDGRSEIVMKTADGTRDGQGNIIGDSTANYVQSGVIAKEIEGKETKHQAHIAGRILTGPEYLTVFEGQTGRALKTIDYVPARGNVADWGDSYGNRSERYLAAVAYLDGKRPSVVMCRGYYTQSHLVAFDWDGHDLKQRWHFDSRNYPGYSGQGNHNLRVGDVDGDGCDEITYGSMAVDHDGTGLYTTGMGHGDAIHQFAFYPNSTTLQIWDVHENKRDGSDFRDARTGRIIFQIPSRLDVGRGMACDIDPTNYGLEMWSASQRGYYDVRGNHHWADSRIPMNSAVWWDGDLLRELLDRNSIMKWDWTTGQCSTLKNFRSEGCTFNNGTKQNPCLSADIIGDWREEVVVRDANSTELRIYSTTIPTQHRFPSLMLDIPYRISVATENVGYNQPPEPGFYFGSDMK